MTTIPALIVSLFLAAAPSFSMEGWITDMEQARLLAGQQNKDLCIVYKGSSWHPEQYGVPERFLASRFFREPMQKGFILVEQDYPANYYIPGILPGCDFANPYDVAGGAPLVVWHNPKLRRTMLVFETPSGIIYQSWTPKEMQDPVTRMKQLNLTGEKRKRQHLLLHIQQEQGAERYRLMKQLFSENDWDRIMPLSPLYKTLRDDARANDRNNLSGIQVNEIKNTFKYMADICWMSQGWACVFDDMNNNRHTSIPEQVRQNIVPEDLQTLLFVQQFFAFLRGLSSYDSLEHFMADAQKEVNAIIAICPKSDQAQQIGPYATRTLPLLYCLNAIFNLADQPDKAMEAIQNLLRQPWAQDYQIRQILGIMTAGCHLKKGDLDTGLDMLKAWRDTFPWTQHAKDADDAITHITANLAVIRDLWNQQQQGNAAAATQYRKHTQLSLNPLQFLYSPDK